MLVSENAFNTIPHISHISQYPNIKQATWAQKADTDQHYDY